MAEERNSTTEEKQFTEDQIRDLAWAYFTTKSYDIAESYSNNGDRDEFLEGMIRTARQTAKISMDEFGHALNEEYSIPVTKADDGMKSELKFAIKESEQISLSIDGKELGKVDVAEGFEDFHKDCNETLDQYLIGDYNAPAITSDLASALAEAIRDGKDDTFDIATGSTKQTSVSIRVEELPSKASEEEIRDAEAKIAEYTKNEVLPEAAKEFIESQTNGVGLNDSSLMTGSLLEYAMAARTSQPGDAKLDNIVDNTHLIDYRFERDGIVITGDETSIAADPKFGTMVEKEQERMIARSYAEQSGKMAEVSIFANTTIEEYVKQTDPAGLAAFTRSMDPAEKETMRADAEQKVLQVLKDTKQKAYLTLFNQLGDKASRKIDEYIQNTPDVAKAFTKQMQVTSVGKDGQSQGAAVVEVVCPNKNSYQNIESCKQALEKSIGGNNGIKNNEFTRAVASNCVAFGTGRQVISRNLPKLVSVPGKLNRIKNTLRNLINDPGRTIRQKANEIVSLAVKFRELHSKEAKIRAELIGHVQDYKKTILASQNLIGVRNYIKQQVENAEKVGAQKAREAALQKNPGISAAKLDEIAKKEGIEAGKRVNKFALEAKYRNDLATGSFDRKTTIEATNNLLNAISETALRYNKAVCFELTIGGEAVKTKIYTNGSIELNSEKGNIGPKNITKQFTEELINTFEGEKEMAQLFLAAEKTDVQVGKNEIHMSFTDVLSHAAEIASKSGDGKTQKNMDDKEIG